MIEKLESESPPTKDKLAGSRGADNLRRGGSIPLRPCLTPGDDGQESVDKSQFQLSVNAATTA